MSSNSTDVHVGSRVRSRRNILGLTLETLAAKIGVTYQQLQKYEKGVNRIGASRLYRLSQVLEVPVDYFFEGLEAGKISVATAIETVLLAERETAELIRTYYRITDTGLRRQIMRLMKALSAPAKASSRRRGPRQAPTRKKAA